MHRHETPRGAMVAAAHEIERRGHQARHPKHDEQRVLLVDLPQERYGREANGPSQVHEKVRFDERAQAVPGREHGEHHGDRRPHAAGVPQHGLQPNVPGQRRVRLEEVPGQPHPGRRQREEHLLRAEQGRAQEQARLREARPRVAAVLLPAQREQQRDPGTQEKCDRRHVGPDLQRLVQEHHRGRQQRGAGKARRLPVPQLAQPEREGERAGAEEPHPAAREQDERLGRSRVRLDGEEPQERRQKEVEPRCVVLEVVPVRQQAPRDAPCAVQVLELVGVEGVPAQQVEAREHGGGEQRKRRRAQDTREPARGAHRSGV
jgi:hypothetical protein